jgi:hypothetical protein
MNCEPDPERNGHGLPVAPQDRWSQYINTDNDRAQLPASSVHYGADEMHHEAAASTPLALPDREYLDALNRQVTEVDVFFDNCITALYYVGAALLVLAVLAVGIWLCKTLRRRGRRQFG